MSTVIEHGVQYFISKGIKCPECDSLNFDVEKITHEIHNSANGIYYLECECGCKWQEVCEE